MKRTLDVFAGAVLAVTFAAATSAMAAGPCAGLPKKTDLQTFLQNAANNTGVSPTLGGSTCVAGTILAQGCVGGLFGGIRMWGAVVNRDGELCAFITSTSDPTQVWPGSQAIAKAKAYTANAFSLDEKALSTALLYTFALPGHSLFGLNNSNLLNTQFLAPTSGVGGGKNQIAGGIITFGGGVPLYSAGNIIGGLGVSGDTACADHEIAKRVRDLAGLNPPGGALIDDIDYTAGIFAHPTCLNTSKNGVVVNANEVPVPLP